MCKEVINNLLSENYDIIESRFVISIDQDYGDHYYNYKYILSFKNSSGKFNSDFRNLEDIKLDKSIGFPKTMRGSYIIKLEMNGKMKLAITDDYCHFELHKYCIINTISLKFSNKAVKEKIQISIGDELFYENWIDGDCFSLIDNTRHTMLTSNILSINFPNNSNFYVDLKVDYEICFI